MIYRIFSRSGNRELQGPVSRSRGERGGQAPALRGRSSLSVGGDCPILTCSRLGDLELQGPPCTAPLCSAGSPDPARSATKILLNLGNLENPALNPAPNPAHPARDGFFVSFPRTRGKDARDAERGCLGVPQRYSAASMSNSRPFNGCTGRLLRWIMAANAEICVSAISIGVVSTNQLTPSEHGGVVNEPS